MVHGALARRGAGRGGARLRHIVRPLAHPLQGGASPAGDAEQDHWRRLPQSEGQGSGQEAQARGRSPVGPPYLRAQRLFAEAGTRPDYFYDGDYGAAIYVDGPHHDYPERKTRDAAKEEAMEDLGYMVIRFGHTDDWEKIVRDYPYVFGGEG